MPGSDVLGRRALLAQGRDVAVRGLDLQEGFRNDGDALVLRESLPGYKAKEEAGEEKRQDKPRA
jgi:hypothetical protein